MYQRVYQKPKRPKLKTLNYIEKYCFPLVPLAGLEPALCHQKRILNPSRLPVPPQRPFAGKASPAAWQHVLSIVSTPLAKIGNTARMTTASIPAERTLLQTLEAMAARAPEEGFTLHEIMDQLDESAFGAGLFFLALPCCIPFLYGVPQVVSLPMMALAGQMVAGREQPWMPEKFGQRKIDRKGLSQMATGGRKWLGWIETFAKPRLTRITGKKSERVIGFFLCLFSASILVPLPMTNTVPGFGVALASFGLMQKDGLMVIGGMVIGSAWIMGLLTAVALGLSTLTGS